MKTKNSNVKTYVVCEPSAKALKKKAFNPEHRIILLHDGSAVLYDSNTLTLIQSDMAYQKVDSHLIETAHPVPEFLYCDAREQQHITTNNIALPFALKLRELTKCWVVKNTQGHVFTGFNSKLIPKFLDLSSVSGQVTIFTDLNEAKEAQADLARVGCVTVLTPFNM